MILIDLNEKKEFKGTFILKRLIDIYYADF